MAMPTHANTHSLTHSRSVIHNTHTHTHTHTPYSLTHSHTLSRTLTLTYSLTHSAVMYSDTLQSFTRLRASSSPRPSRRVNPLVQTLQGFQPRTFSAKPLKCSIGFVGGSTTRQRLGARHHPLGPTFRRCWGRSCVSQDSLKNLSTSSPISVTRA